MTMLGSRYIATIQTEVEEWSKKLAILSETLDEWLQCQRNWMYLETIFGSADIVRQLPVSAKMFQAVDKSWKSIMKATNDEPNAIVGLSGVMVRYQDLRRYYIFGIESHDRFVLYRREDESWTMLADYRNGVD